MAKKSHSKGVDRRSFLTGIATAGAAAVAVKPSPAAAAQASAKLPPLSPIEIAAETAQVQFTNDRFHVRNPGSDFMVDVIKNFDFDYIAAIPGNTFRGLHESLINYGGNKKPELISVGHEEVSAAMAHGYAKIAGKPMAIMVHNTVGLQHASMAMYDAWADRVPMMVIVGNADFDATKRPGAVDWEHSATDVAAMVRGFIKYDDQPVSLGHFAESFARAYSLSMTPPTEPVVIVADGGLQEDTVEGPRPPIAKYVPVRPPAADANALADAAKLIVAAKNPVIFAERCARTPGGVGLLVQLAELLQAPVVDMQNRMNFPTNHYLNQTFNQGEFVGSADLILALEVDNLFGTVGTVLNVPGHPTRMRVKPGTKVISIDSQYAASAGNYQDKQRFYQADLPIAGDAEATLPQLIEAVQQAMPAARRNENQTRAAQWQQAFHRRRIADRNLAANGWDASPVSVPRLCMETWAQIKGHDWALVSGAPFQSFWPQRLWDFTKGYQYSGWAGAYGVGYGLPAAVGAALALKGKGDGIAVNIQGDGDFMMLPAALWTATHHRIPLLTIMHNNRAWHQELMFVTQMADQRDRPASGALVGTTIDDPAPNYAMIARGFGMYAEGPITSPDALGPALERAIKIVKGGHPALIDVVTEGR